MVYEDAKRFVLEYIRLGMTLERAFLAVDCDEQTQDKMLEDVSFVREVAREDAMLEGKLKQIMVDLADSNSEKGISVEVRWLLEHQWPGIYGTRINQATISPDLPLPDLKIRDEA